MTREPAIHDFAKFIINKITPVLLRSSCCPDLKYKRMIEKQIDEIEYECSVFHEKGLSYRREFSSMTDKEYKAWIEMEKLR